MLKVYISHFPKTFRQFHLFTTLESTLSYLLHGFSSAYFLKFGTVPESILSNSLYILSYLYRSCLLIVFKSLISDCRYFKCISVYLNAVCYHKAFLTALYSCSLNSPFLCIRFSYRVFTGAGIADGTITC